jgi:formate dehydrogenase subunit gamma
MEPGRLKKTPPMRHRLAKGGLNGNGMLSAEQLRQIDEAIAAHRSTEGAALPMLHDIQAALGHVPREALPLLAEALNISRAEMHGIVSFYHDFRETPSGRHCVKLCQAEACQAMGGRALTEEVTRLFGVRLGETSADGALTMEPVYCLGLCAVSPAALVDGEPLGRVDAAMLAEVLQR